MGTAVIYSKCGMGHCNKYVKFEFNDIISLYVKNDSERSCSVSLFQVY